jgi:hypothetical protein
MNKITDWFDVVDAYNDRLNDTHDEVEIAGIGFLPSEILRECDPIAYRVGLSDWLDSEGIDTDDLEGDYETAI